MPKQNGCWKVETKTSDNCIFHASAVCSEMFVWDNSAFCCWQFYFYAARGRFGHVFFSSSMCLNMTSGINDKCIWKYISLKQDTKTNTRKQLVMKTRMTIKQQPKYYIYMNLLLWSQCVSIGSADRPDQHRMYICKYEQNKSEQ